MYCIILISFHLVILWRYSITTKIICIICFSVFIHYLFIHSRCLATSLKKWHLLTIIFYSLPLSFLEITWLQKNHDRIIEDGIRIPEQFYDDDFSPKLQWLVNDFFNGMATYPLIKTIKNVWYASYLEHILSWILH